MPPSNGDTARMLAERIAAKYRQSMQGRHGQDFVADEAAEFERAKEAVTAYVAEVPGGEASMTELKQLLLLCGLDPQHAMTFAKRLLVG